LETYLEDRNLTAKSKACLVTHLRKFYQWAVTNGFYSEDPTAGIGPIKVKVLPPRPIEEKDLEKALTFADWQMRCMLYMYAFAGVKPSEMAAMTTEDILHDGWLHVPSTHQSAERIVPMHPDLENALTMLNRKKGQYLFENERKTRGMTGDEISWYVGKHLSDLGIRSTGASLRHYFAVQTLKACHDLRVVQKLIGGINPRNVEKYKTYDELAGKQAVGSLGFGQRGDGTT
jgi:integrase/recombinase XerD